ncbi:MAG: S-layer homology domain-containing protein, partial [Clostridia bacterium]|nr:S-layer homology domain-containing protein [Clostridia bacterium]
MYVYCENPHKVPLSFDITRDVYMKDAEIPAELSGKQVLASVSGSIGPRDMKTFTMPWSWDTETDEKDTALGNKAMGEDLLYTLKIMFIIEDNNTYEIGGGGSGDGIKLPASGTSSAKLRHRAYVKGYPDSSFRPDGSMTRAEVAAIFARILADYNEDALTSRNTSFPDVPEKSWFTPYVSRMESMKLINGYPDGSFQPDGTISRAEFAAICVRFYEKRTTNIKPVDIDFTDLANEHWSYKTIRKAVANSYVKGYPDGSFRPDQDITRAEVVTVVNRMLERSADKDYVDKHIRKLGQFTDVKNNEYWAYYDIYEAAHEHITTCNENGEKWGE